MIKLIQFEWLYYISTNMLNCLTYLDFCKLVKPEHICGNFYDKK